jgi:putative cardiolipin synthase
VGNTFIRRKKMNLQHKTLLGTFLVLSLFLLAACTRLPDNSQKVASHVISDGDYTSLGKALKPQIVEHPGQSGVFLLGNGVDAFVGRVVLAIVRRI